MTTAIQWKGTRQITTRSTYRTILSAIEHITVMVAHAQLGRIAMGVHFSRDKEDFFRRLVSRAALDGQGPSAVEGMYKTHFGKVKPRNR